MFKSSKNEIKALRAEVDYYKSKYENELKFSQYYFSQSLEDSRRIEKLIRAIKEADEKITKLKEEKVNLLASVKILQGDKNDD